MITATARDGAVNVDGVALPFADNSTSGAIKLGLRPEHLRFANRGLEGRVTQIEPMGREILYVVETTVGQIRVLEHGSSAAHAAGETVSIGFAPEDSLVFDAVSERLLPDVRVRPSA